MPDLKIRFKLQDLYQVEPWGQTDKTLGWFGLSDGCYCIETSSGSFFELAEPAVHVLGEPWLDYQVARLFQDFISIWPVICDPIPDDIITYFSSFAERNGAVATSNNSAMLWDSYKLWYDDQDKRGRNDPKHPLSDALWESCEWWRLRRLDTFYLAIKPNLPFWRTGSDIHLAWDSAYPWLPERVRLTLPFETVQAALKTFVDDFLDQMDDRVRHILRNGWQGKDCHIDLAHLAKTQTQCEISAIAALSRIEPTDWNLLRQNLQKLED